MRRFRQQILFVLVILVSSGPAFAQERIEDMAVLEISFYGKELTQQQKEFLSDDIRQAAMKLTQYRIMTKESVFAILRDKKIDPSKCDAECEVEFGRMLQADRLVTSAILFFEQVYYIKIKLYDVGKASMENAVDRECPRCAFSELRKMVQDAAQELFGGVVGAMPVKIKEEVGETVKKTKEPFGIFVYPSIQYYFSEIGGVNYGGGVGYRIVKFVGLGAQFTTGELSKDDVSGSSSFIELYALLGLNLIKKEYLGVYIKPGVNYQSISGNDIEKTGIGVRWEAGLYSFPGPICIFLGGFLGKVTTGLSLSIGGYF